MKKLSSIAACMAAAIIAVHAQPQPAPTDLPAVDAPAMLKTAVPDLDQRIAQFKPVRMPFDPAGLTDRERQMIDQLVAASRELESIYWRQADPVGLSLYKALAANDTPVAKASAIICSSTAAGGISCARTRRLSEPRRC